MNISKITVSILSATILLAGCTYEGQKNESEGGPGSGGDVATPDTVTGVYWELKHENTQATFASDDLPNIYLFSGSQLLYYHDDEVNGTYEIENSAFELSENEGGNKTINFTYYEPGAFESGTIEDADYYEITGTYSFNSDGQLIIEDTGNYGSFNGIDYSDSDEVTDAVSDADDRNDIVKNNTARIQNINTELTGNLNIALDEEASAGTLEIDFTYRINDEAVENEDNATDAYVALYTAGGLSSANSYGELKFYNPVEGQASIGYRDTQSSFVDICHFTIGQELSIDAKWGEDEFTFSIENANLISDDSTCEKTVKYAVNNDPVKFLGLRIANKVKTSNYEILADNIKVMSIKDQGNVNIFENDFEEFSDGDVLGGAHGFRGESTQATVKTFYSNQ